jgi:hypothetical protein
MKTRHYVNFGTRVITVAAEIMEHLNGVMFTAYVENCSVRSHYLQNENIRRLWIDGICAILEGADDAVRKELNTIVDIELKAYSSR